MPTKMIDVNLSFVDDTPGYWDGFWTRKDGLGAGGADPDADSPTLQHYHQMLWSRELPCGKVMDLKAGSGSDYLSWDGFRFGSDSILVSFRYERCRSLLNEVAETVGDYKAFVEGYLRRMYTIGGMIIFPKHLNSINQAKGTNRLICDRWDLTLECIRRYYAGEDSPLYPVLRSDQEFFSLFNDFKGYVDYFFLQDCVSEDYKSVDIWMGAGNLCSNPLPRSVSEYLHWIRAELDFLARRNKRISQFLLEHNI